MDKVGTKYCILENDGVSLCVCKHRPCEQLKRKEQKCNELIDNNFELAQKYTRKEQECEELKDKSDYWKDKYADVHIRLTNQVSELKAECERLKEEKGGMQILIDNYIALTEKYRQALQEIRDIAIQAEQKLHCVCNITEMLLDIEAKINEVIGAEDV